MSLKSSVPEPGESDKGSGRQGEMGSKGTFQGEQRPPEKPSQDNKWRLR